MKKLKLPFLLIAMVALMATMMTGCAVHRYEMRYGVNQEGGYVSACGKPDTNDLRVLYNEKAWSDSLWKAQARRLNAEAVTESLLAVAYLNGSPAGAGALQMGVVINETGHPIQIRGRKKILCPLQADTLFLRSGHYGLVVDHFDSRRSDKLLYTRSISFDVDGIRGNASIAGMGDYDWNWQITP